jgi:peptidoglycan/xylan/chitin deacetylase (PgdA/CDA1 family)
VRSKQFQMVAFLSICHLLAGGLAGSDFRWPEGKRAAISLSFDDGRPSQVDTGLALLDKYGVKATFYVLPDRAKTRLDGWKRAVASGHEIGNHSRSHPCTANYTFSLKNALEEYNLARMAADLDGANSEIEHLLGVRPVTFAYPCGQKFVGRGRNVKSYVPLVATRFLVGRGYLDEAANNPGVCDLAQAMGTYFDGLEFKQMMDLVSEAAKQRSWLIFVGHDIGKLAHQTTDAAALEALLKYLRDPTNGLWVDTVAAVGRYVQQQRSSGAKGLR